MTNELQERTPQGLSPANKMKNFTSNEGIQEMIRQSLGASAGAFTTSLIELYSDPTGTLKDCEPKAVVMEALKAATLKLPLNKNLGFAWVIPYKKKRKIKDQDGKDQWIEVSIPQFQMGYKGYIQLAMRTGQYYTINTDIIYEGMEIETDYLSGSIKISGRPKSDKAIGYFAYFKLLNGFEKVIYWTTEQVHRHAAKHSAGYKSMQAAKQKNYYKPENYVWDNNFDDMALKTLLNRLLSKYGVLSTEMQKAIMQEADTILLEEIKENANSFEYKEPPTMIEAPAEEITDQETGEITTNKTETIKMEDLKDLDVPF